MKQVPIACTLDTAEQVERAGSGRRLAEDFMTGWLATEGGAELRFSREAEPALRELIAAESQCCSFLDFDLRAEGDRLALTVDGPEAARPIIAELFGLGPTSRRADSNR